MKDGRTGRKLIVLALVVAAALLVIGAPAATAGAGGSGTAGMQDMQGMHGMTDEEMQNMQDMQGMHGMTDEEMQNMPGMTSGGSAHDGHVMDAGMSTGGGSVNWAVIGGFAALVGGSTLAAVALKRHLRRRMLAGQLAGAGVRNG
jgi:hypothetical protein